MCGNLTRENVFTEWHWKKIKMYTARVTYSPLHALSCSLWTRDFFQHWELGSHLNLTLRLQKHLTENEWKYQREGGHFASLFTRKICIQRAGVMIWSFPVLFWSHRLSFPCTSFPVIVCFVPDCFLPCEYQAPPSLFPPESRSPVYLVCVFLHDVDRALLFPPVARLSFCSVQLKKPFVWRINRNLTPCAAFGSVFCPHPTTAGLKAQHMFLKMSYDEITLIRGRSRTC